MNKLITLFPVAVLMGCQSTLSGAPTREFVQPTPQPAAPAPIHCQNTIVVSPGTRIPPGGIRVSCVGGEVAPVEAPEERAAARSRQGNMMFELRPVR